MPWPDWQARHDAHQQPRRSVDYTRPGFVRPPDPEPEEWRHCDGCGEDYNAFEESHIGHGGGGPDAA